MGLVLHLLLLARNRIVRAPEGFALGDGKGGIRAALPKYPKLQVVISRAKGMATGGGLAEMCRLIE